MPNVLLCSPQHVGTDLHLVDAEHPHRLIDGYTDGLMLRSDVMAFVGEASPDSPPNHAATKVFLDLRGSAYANGMVALLGVSGTVVFIGCDPATGESTDVPADVVAIAKSCFGSRVAS